MFITDVRNWEKGYFYYQYNRFYFVVYNEENENIHLTPRLVWK